jgi:hypothetical protein
LSWSRTRGPVSGHASLQGGREGRRLYVVVVVYLGHVLAGGGPNDSSRALDEESVERNWACKEQGVESGRVEPFTDEGRGADDELGSGQIGRHYAL